MFSQIVSSYYLIYFYIALSGNDRDLLTILYIDMSFIYLSSFEPYLQQYLNLYLVSICGILIRVLIIVFAYGLRLVFKPYLTRIWPVQVETSVKPFVNQSVLILLLASHINVPYQIVWERLSIKFNLVVLSYRSTQFYKFMKVYLNYCCKR